MVRDKLTIRVMTGDKISTFVFNNCVGSGSSTHDVVGQHMMVLQIFSTVTGQKVSKLIIIFNQYVVKVSLSDNYPAHKLSGWISGPSFVFYP